MARHGFKVHKLKAARGVSGRLAIFPAAGLNREEIEAQRKSKTPDADAGDLLDKLVERLREMVAHPESLTGVPPMISVADGSNQYVPPNEPGTPRLVVQDVTVSARRISVLVEYGHLGYSHRAVGSTKTDQAQLTDKSPMQFYRHEFLVPSKGTEGLVVAEVIAGGSAVAPLTAWINHFSRNAYGDDHFARLMVPGMADQDRLKKFLGAKVVTEVVLIKKSKATDGAPKSSTIRLTEEIGTDSKSTNMAALAGSWVDRQQTDDPYAAAERMSEVGKLAELVDPLAPGMEFTDGVIKFQAEGEKVLTVTPSRAAEIFVYSISEHRPDDSTWLDRVKDQAEKMAAAEDMSVVWG